MDTEDRSFESIHWPPYGEMHAEMLSYLASNAQPKGFRLTPQSSTDATPQEWLSWLENLTNTIAGFLWPRYDDRGWHGASQQHMLALTRADLQVMDGLRPCLTQAISHCRSGHCTAQHLALFEQEDQNAPVATLAEYDASFYAHHGSRFRAAVVTGGADIARPLSLHLKRRLQRPRPYQASCLLGQVGFSYRLAKSGVTPSMVSGHCLQGVLALCQVLISLSSELASDSIAQACVRQFLIDTGDRRVFAGVHYPSDNLGSWYAALCLCPHVFGVDAQRVKSALWDAINSHSLVLRAMRAAGDPVYLPLLAELQAEAARQVPS
ncbi:phosphatase PAP2 family protein [Paucibacter sp. XJ19-41]|uniref:phosphatase PAP2 family protein n=1 Tax=Paucibacter sp. XJ19-41 TaxID=2927824 RepID=UPI00234A6595|nr:phosphatase PAP2 family protein [Paucibacter sp. XJ19-41]MDC6167048.1 phosphatase PAP2 family protein [Paucibacter sp. XJ19-41]